MPMPIDELRPINPAFAQRYTEAVGQYDGMVLRFSPELARPLPTTLEELRKRLAAVFIPLTSGYPDEVDLGPRLVWRDGQEGSWEIGVARTGRPGWRPGQWELETTNAKAWDAARLLGDGLDLIERDWLAHKRAVWIAARTAERSARQYLSIHLLQSFQRTNQAEADYLGGPGTDLVARSRTGPRFLGLDQALGALAAARTDLDVDPLNTQKNVIGAAALAAAVLPLEVAAKLPGDVPASLEDFESLAKDTAQRHEDALLRYLAKMRQLAGEHPILLVLQHLTKDRKPAGSSTAIERADQINTLKSAVRDALGAVRAAIAELRIHVAEHVIAVSVPDTDPPQLDGPPPPQFDTLATSIGESSRLAVWKLPLFIDHAISELPPDHQNMVCALRSAGFERCAERLFARDMALNIVQIVASFIPVARPVAIALSIAMGLMRLRESVTEYEELNMLYHASMDPGFLALGNDAHDPAGTGAIVFDLFALYFDLHGLGKVVR